MRRLYLQHRRDDKHVNLARENRRKIDESITSRDIAVSAIEGTLITSTAVGGAATLGGVLTGGVTLLAGTALGVGAHVGGKVVRGVTNENRKSDYINFKRTRYDLNHPTDLARICRRSDVHECKDLPKVIDYAIQLSNELYGVPRGRDSDSLAHLCESEGFITSDTVRKPDVTKQAVDLSATYNGKYPIPSDVTPLESLCGNKKLFTLPHEVYSEIGEAAIKLARSNEKEWASRTTGTHQRPLRKLSQNPNLPHAGPEILGQLRNLSDRLGWTEQDNIFGHANNLSIRFSNIIMRSKAYKKSFDKDCKTLEDILKKREVLKEKESEVDAALKKVKDDRREVDVQLEEAAEEPNDVTKPSVSSAGTQAVSAEPSPRPTLESDFLRNFILASSTSSCHSTVAAEKRKKPPAPTKEELLTEAKSLEIDLAIMEKWDEFHKGGTFPDEIRLRNAEKKLDQSERVKYDLAKAIKANQRLLEIDQEVLERKQSDLAEQTVEYQDAVKKLETLEIEKDQKKILLKEKYTSIVKHRVEHNHMHDTKILEKALAEHESLKHIDLEEDMLVIPTLMAFYKRYKLTLTELYTNEALLSSGAVQPTVGEESK